MTATQQEQLGQLLSQQDFWTLPQIDQLIQQHFTCRYSSSGLRRLLKRMNLHHYKPQPRDYRQSPMAVEQLQTRLQATLDALSLRAESLSEFAIGFADEFAPQLHHNRARLWSVFKDKLRPLNTTRYSQSTFGFYAIQGQSMLAFMANGKAASMQTILQAVRRANPTAQRILLLWDNARAHLDRQVQALAWSLGIYLVALPAYSPNLNPIERVWKSIRRGLSEIGLIDSVASLQSHIKRLFDSLVPTCSFAKSWIEQLLNPVYELNPVSG